MSGTGSESDDQLLSLGPAPESTRLALQQQAAALPPPVVDPGSSHPSRSSHSSRDGRTRSSRRGHGHRSRSSGSRSRSRHRHSSRHHNCHNCRMYLKHKERNYAAAATSMIATVLLCTALAPASIHLTGGGCHFLRDPEGSLKHLSTSMFFYNGHFYKKYPQTEVTDSVYKCGRDSSDIMVNCVTYSSVLLFKTSIAFTMIAIICSSAAFLLDIIGPSYQLLKLLRRNALFNIMTAIVCVALNLFTYWIVTSVEKLQISTRLHVGSRVEVTFAASFYLVTAAGAASVLATACNCLRRYNIYESSESSRHSEHLYVDDTESLLPAAATHSDGAALTDVPPPPAYTP